MSEYDDSISIGDCLGKAKVALEIAADCINVAVENFELIQQNYARLLVTPFTIRSDKE